SANPQCAADADALGRALIDFRLTGLVELDDGAEDESLPQVGRPTRRKLWLALRMSRDAGDVEVSGGPNPGFLAPEDRLAELLELFGRNEVQPAVPTDREEQATDGRLDGLDRIQHQIFADPTDEP